MGTDVSAKGAKKNQEMVNKNGGEVEFLNV